MKTIKKLIYSCLAIATIVSCAKSTEFNDTETVAVQQLHAPNDNSSIELLNTPLAETQFSWVSPSKTNPQGYIIAFYDAKTGGNEISRIAVPNSATSMIIKHDQLVAVAALAGIEPEKSGDLFWGVISTRGTAEVASNLRNQLTLTRYAGIKDVPTNLYIGGVADANFSQFRKLSNGNFEMFIQIDAAENYYFSSRNAEGGAKYYTVDGTLSEKAAKSDAVTTSGLYYITVNFLTARVTQSIVTDVELRTENGSTPMNYIGGGEFEWAGNDGNNKVINLGSNRTYRFDAKINNSAVMLGSAVAENNSDPAQTTGSYYNVVLYNYNWGIDRMFWRVPSVLTSKAVNKLNLFLNGQQYRHEIVYDPVVISTISLITTPSELVNTTTQAPYDLSTAAVGASFNFTWSEVGSANVTQTTQIKFFTKNSGVLSERLNVGPTSPLLFTASTANIENIAKNSGVLPGGVVEIFWSVTNSAYDKVSESEMKSFFVKRAAPTIPTQLFITGNGSEYGSNIANAGKLRALGSNKFEIYTKVSSSGFNFVDATSGLVNKYSVVNNVLTPSDAAIKIGDGIYKITVDFNTNTMKAEKITKVWMINNGSGGNSSANASLLNEMNYIGQGQWSMTNASVIGSLGSGNGARYRFNACIDGVDYAWGYSRTNNDGPEVFHYTEQDPTKDNLAPQYIYTTPFSQIQSNEIVWHYTFKDSRGGDNKHQVTSFTIFMNGDATDSQPHYHVGATWSGTNPAVNTHFFTSL